MSQHWNSNRDVLIGGPIFIWLALLGFLLEPAALSQYRFDVLNTDNGLPQNSVYSILQTRDGYLWLTTLDGLVRYDGAHFKIFSKATEKGINSNRFTRLFEDRDGILWACTEDGGLTRYRNGVFTTYTTEHGLPDNWIYNLRQTDAGDILVHTHTGLARWQDGRFQTVSTDVNSFDMVLGYQGPSGAIWYRLGTTLRRVKNGEITTYTVPEYSPDDQDYPQLYEDREGRLWIGTAKPELLMLKDGALSRYTAKDGLPQAKVTAFCEDRKGALWFGTEAGLVRFQDGKFVIFTTRHGLPVNYIVTMYEDREGRLWVGTNAGGLVNLNIQIITAYSEKEGLPSKSYYPMLEDHAGNIWIGGGGLYRLKEGQFSYYPLNISPDARRGHARFKQVSALYEDEDGRLWIGSDRDVFSFKDEKFMVETERIGSQTSALVVYAIHRDKNGTMWFCTNYGVIEYRGGLSKRYTTDDGLPSRDAHTILEDREGSLWVGTYGGLARLSNGRFTSYTETDGLSSNRVRSLYQDREGVLWIGTYDGGLNRFKDGRFTRYTMSEGLFSNGVFQILEDDAGNFWMSSNQGICRVPLKQLNDFADGRIAALTPLSFGTADGMRSAECDGGQQPAGFRAHDGKLWFPTISGVVVVDPKALTLDPVPPPVVIQSVRLDRKEIDFTQPVRIYPEQQSVEVDYAGLSFIKPDHVRFRYKLEGADSDWVEAGSRRTAFYSHLPAGNYTFKVIAANKDGVWNEEAATLKIVIVPPFWRRWWFIALATTTFVAIGVIVLRARIKKVKRARELQEAFSRQLIASQEGERKRIAAELHDSLGQDLIVIKNWASMAKRFLEPGESRALKPLEEIASAAAHSIEEVREIAANLRPYQLDEIGLTEAINSMIEKVADSSGIRFAVETDSIDGLLPSESEINLYRVVQEGVNNIVKHSGASNAEITITRDSQSIHIVIKDNGDGFELAQVLNKKDHGFGLTGISERVRILGGVQSIESVPGEGTTISIVVALQGDQV
jgi:ligand-binding sensor domain-containing protein/signal transduction histidine kinase